MRLSEAIRLGSLILDKVEGYDTSTCAIGMGLAATGTSIMAEDLPEPPRKFIPVPYSALDHDEVNYQRLAALWPWIEQVAPTQCPWCDAVLGKDRSDIEARLGFIHHPFDCHVIEGDVTLEQLCDFIRTIEPADQPEPELAAPRAAAERPEKVTAGAAERSSVEK